MCRSGSRWYVGVVLACVLTQASAQTGEEAEPGNRDAGAKGRGDDTSVRLGLGAALLPEYRGADTYRGRALPLIDIRRGQVYASTFDGIGWDAIRRGGLTAGPFVTYAGGRDDTGAISKLDDIDGGAMAGLAAGWQRGPWRMEAELATPVSGDLDGVRAQAGLRYRARMGARWMYAVGPGVVWGSGAWNDALFSVSAAESARSGLSAHEADRAYYELRVSARLVYRITPSWSIAGAARAGRMLGDAADSPIVADTGDATQAFGALALGYRF